MIIKNSSALFTVLAIIGIVWAITVVVRHSTHFHVQDSNVQSVSNQKLIAAVRQQNHLQQLDQTLDLINEMGNKSHTPLKVLSVNIDRSTTSLMGDKLPAADDTTQQAQIASPTISLVYISSTMKKVGINGNLYSIDDKLPDGGRIISITEQSIGIMQHGRREVMLLTKPHPFVTTDGVNANNTDLQ